MIQKLLRQRRIPLLGETIDALYTSLPILSILNFISIMVILYNNIRPYLIENLPWVNLWIFIAIIGGLASIVILLVFKFVLPSIWTFRAKQMFEHESKISDKLDRILEQLEEKKL